MAGTLHESTKAKRKSTKGKAVAVYFTEEWQEVYEQVKEVSAREHRSVSQTILLALQESLRPHKET